MTEDKLIAGVSGLRGIWGQSLHPVAIMRYVVAAMSELNEGAILVGRDSRPSGVVLARLVEGTASALGRRVCIAGIVATPTVGVLVTSRQLSGAIQITASHNPAPYNGIKLFDHRGQVVSPEVGMRIGQRFSNLDLEQSRWADHRHVGSAQTIEDPLEEHLRRILATVDVDRIRESRFRVLLDSNHGAGSPLGKRLLEALGCEVECVGSNPDGEFEHAPEPIEENLRNVGQHVVRTEAQVGFCQDPDADRLALLDENGTYVGEEYTLALCVKRCLELQPGPVVINCATSRMTADLCHRVGVPCIRAPVGEAHVVKAMQQVGAVYGGEGNGGPIDPRVVFVRDSFVGMAQILDLMARTQQRLSDLVRTLPAYSIVKRKWEFVSQQQLERALDRLARQWADADSIDRQDGTRWDWSDRWVLVRASNTEPLVRVIAEAMTAQEAERLCNIAQAAFDN